MNNSKNNMDDGGDMITHDPEATPLKGWHLDKRISVAHILATVGMTAALSAWLWALSERVMINEQGIEHHEDIVSLELTGIQAQLAAARTRDKEMLGEWLRQNQEILHRLDRIEDSTKLSLDRIEDGVNRHIEASGQGHKNGG